MPAPKTKPNPGELKAFLKTPEVRRILEFRKKNPLKPLPIKEIAFDFQRGHDTIRRTAQRLVELGRVKPWSEIAAAHVRENPHKTIAELMEALGVSKATILGLRKTIASENQGNPLSATPKPARASNKVRLTTALSSLDEQFLRAFRGNGVKPRHPQ